MNDVLEPKFLRSSAVFEQIPAITLHTFRFFSVHAHLQRMLSGQSTSFPGSYSLLHRKWKGKSLGTRLPKEMKCCTISHPECLGSLSSGWSPRETREKSKTFQLLIGYPVTAPSFTCITELKKIQCPSLSLRLAARVWVRDWMLHSSAMFGEIRPALTGPERTKETNIFKKQPGNTEQMFGTR